MIAMTTRWPKQSTDHLKAEMPKLIGFKVEALIMTVGPLGAGQGVIKVSKFADEQRVVHFFNAQLTSIHIKISIFWP